MQKYKNYYHLVKAILALIIYQSPSSQMTVIGVTGTDGKTTTASIIYHILKSLGYKTALISTVSAVIDGKEYNTGFHVSTPDSLLLQSYIAKAKKAGVTHLVLEVTSHALDQHRVFGIHFDVGVLTNISQEHLDYHKTMTRYINAKIKLLNMAKTAVINKDDSSFEKVRNLLTTSSVMTYGVLSDSDINTKNTPFNSSLPGDYNKQNVLASLAAVSVLNVDMDRAVQSIRTIVPPKGRFETVYDKEFKVIIDFAHTPYALEQMFKSFKKTGDIIHVFGCAGDRDKSKRKLMGEVSSKFADHIVLTAEDPRKESISEINDQIKKGISSKEVLEIEDRQEAIDHAVLIAKKGDIVIITGKGHEESMNFGKGEVPWSEHQAVHTALLLRGKV